MKLITACVAAFVLAAPLHAQDTVALTPSGDPAPIRAVKLITAGGDATQNERVFFGQVAALETVDLSFEVGGRLVMFEAEEGQFLEQGAQIAALNLAPFERAVERARLELAQADRDLTRAQTLVQSNAASATQAENAETARDLAAVSWREAADALDDARLAAPFRALVASRLTPNFANVTPGQPIVRLHDMSEVRVEIDVPERLFQSLADVDGISFFGTSPLFEGEVPLAMREFNAETQNIGQSYRVTFALPPDQIPPAIIPGASMTVTARLSAGDAHATILPPSAVAIGTDGARVMVYTPGDDGQSGTVDWRVVDVTSANGTQITVSGLDPAALVVGAGIQMLRAGDTVRPFTSLSVR
ncbi:efflux RND transporter periplasmic adaptor subunit [Yoonia vestfoldensis]|jgi:RND family efflux transporter MFP subunit|uniref:Putative efflux pump membrane fusion protein n=1 Tax=Yoonia vestfoldensis TaxID=245188 RepID=A0A1Y0E9T5_9RHOB|nr:efflux RND transporter periplasmic adaptor subunit [Yoonia vestfoldensis]ARU00132.1 putative efflux pump membrane fusion protein [Yoonia vestfoldensis]